MTQTANQAILNQLRPNLDDTDFEQLVELGRSVLPKYAPTWTDHNLHDPGIMLMEMMAFLSEAQIYSLARSRTDERWAYAALLGMRPRGPVPAQGMVWPNPANSQPERGRVLPAGARLNSGLSQTPPFFLPFAVNLSAARLMRVLTLLADGSSINHSMSNLQPGAVFYPFGPQPQPGNRLQLWFEGSLLAQPEAQPDGSLLSARECALCLGVAVTPLDWAYSDHAADDSQTGAPTQTQSPGHAACSPLQASLLVGQISYALAVRFDSSGGMQRSGVIGLDLAAVPPDLGQSFCLEISLAQQRPAAAAAISTLQTNVLPMIQLETRTALPMTWLGGTQPDQVFDPELPGVLYQNDQPELTLEFYQGQTRTRWQVQNDLYRAGPNDAVYAWDSRTGLIRFGNGINGKIPPHGQVLYLSARLSSGSTGNLPAGLEWHVAGIDAWYGVNQQATRGGQDALDLPQLQRMARAAVRNAHPIVTDADLQQAALAQIDLQVARAEVLPPGANPGRRLLALRTRSVSSGENDFAPELAPEFAPESRRWLNALQAALAGRMLLGERLHVVAARYRPFAVRAVLLAQAGYDMDDLQQQAYTLLQALFALIPALPGQAVWPLGRAVMVQDIRARLRQIEGIASVRSCSLWQGEQMVEAGSLPMQACDLPFWLDAASQIQILPRKGAQ